MIPVCGEVVRINNDSPNSHRDFAILDRIKLALSELGELHVAGAFLPWGQAHGSWNVFGDVNRKVFPLKSAFYLDLNVLSGNTACVFNRNTQYHRVAVEAACQLRVENSYPRPISDFQIFTVQVIRFARLLQRMGRNLVALFGQFQLLMDVVPPDEGRDDQDAVKRQAQFVGPIERGNVGFVFYLAVVATFVTSGVWLADRCHRRGRDMLGIVCLLACSCAGGLTVVLFLHFVVFHQPSIL